jgi:hypothetical protein
MVLSRDWRSLATVMGWEGGQEAAVQAVSVLLSCRVEHRRILATGRWAPA